jgi:hypothetical protein
MSTKCSQNDGDGHKASTNGNKLGIRRFIHNAKIKKAAFLGRPF